MGFSRCRGGKPDSRPANWRHCGPAGPWLRLQSDLTGAGLVADRARGAAVGWARLHTRLWLVSEITIPGPLSKTAAVSPFFLEITTSHLPTPNLNLEPSIRHDTTHLGTRHRRHSECVSSAGSRYAKAQSPTRRKCRRKPVGSGYAAQDWATSPGDLSGPRRKFNYFYSSRKLTAAFLPDRTTEPP